jgi:hypothetical protein
MQCCATLATSTVKSASQTSKIVEQVGDRGDAKPAGSLGKTVVQELPYSAAVDEILDSVLSLGYTVDGPY